MAALMIGSMAPDFAYFNPTDTEFTSHTFRGLFTFCLPVGWIVWLFFVRVLERPTIALLSDRWRNRFARSERQITMSVLLRVSAALLLGAVTHVVWDSFTHQNTPLITWLPGLHLMVFEINGHRLFMYSLLQILSSIVGLAILALWARKIRSAPALHEQHPIYPVTDKLRVGALVFSVAMTFAGAVSDGVYNMNEGRLGQLFHFLIGGMTGAALAWCCVAALINWKARSWSRGKHPA